jgi:hypothetical protein
MLLVFVVARVDARLEHMGVSMLLRCFLDAAFTPFYARISFR